MSPVGVQVATAERNGNNAKLPHFLREQFGLAAVEHGDEEIAAAIEVIRRRRRVRMLVARTGRASPLGERGALP